MLPANQNKLDIFDRPQIISKLTTLKNLVLALIMMKHEKGLQTNVGGCAWEKSCCRVPTIVHPPSPSARGGVGAHGGGGQLSEEEAEDNRITAPPFPPEP